MCALWCSVLVHNKVRYREGERERASCVGGVCSALVIYIVRALYGATGKGSMRERWHAAYERDGNGTCQAKHFYVVEAFS